MLNVKALRRSYEAAEKDGTPQRFFEDFQQGLEEGSIHLRDLSIRRLFEEFVPDGREIVDSWNPRFGGAGEVLVEEAGAVTTGQFAKITGQLLVNATIQAYDMEENVFSKILPTVPTQLSGQKVPGISRLGDNAAAVGEGQQFPMAGVSQDYFETPQTTKRGEIVALTKEAVFFDLTGQLVDRCGEVGTFLGVNKEKRIIDTVIDENVTTYRYKWLGTSYATYQSSSPWINVKATNGLVDWTNVDAAELVLNQITDPFTGEPIVITAKHLVVTRQNMNVAKRVLTATNIASITPGYATSGNPNMTSWANPINGYTLVWSAQLAARMATDSSWYIGDLTKAFAYYENWPITVVQAPANAEAEFQRDIVMQWKASERGTPVTTNPRYMCKNTA